MSKPSITDETPEPGCAARPCNGGPTGPWCGRPSKFVARDGDGLEWFCCDDHTEGATRQPIRDWFKAHGLQMPEDPT